nr:transcription factor bHLH155-like isoform X2 [Ipomoea batatas]
MSPDILPCLDVEDFINGNLLMDVIQSFPVATSSPVDDQITNVSMENKTGFDCYASDRLLQQSPLPGSDNYFNMSQPFSRWGSEASYATSSRENLAFGMVAQGSSVPPHFERFSNSTQNAAERLVMESSADELRKLVQKPTSVCTFDESSRVTDDFVESLMADSLGDDLSCAVGLIPSPSNMNKQFMFNSGSGGDPSVSTESSITNAFNSHQKEKCSKTPFIHNLSNDFECKKPEKWDNNLRSATSSHNWDYGTSSSGCTSEHSVGSKRPSNTLFSNLGLDQLLYGTARSSCSFDRPGLNNQSLSTSKTRRFESFSPSSNMMKPSDLYSLDGLQTSIETVTKFNSGSWIGDSRSINAGNPDLQAKGHGKPSKAIKKKGKPGSRPIPKDRLQTYARLAELRELIPNGEKMSIDRLLHRTIKQLHFLQSVTKHAKRLGKTEALKDRKDQNHSNNVANGVTWACEIENETMICPLIVEDLSTPGQMLIEILCQEQGFFLEIVDIIRGFGLNILTGFMEVHEAKICAHYIVEAEANRFVSRHEIFSSLVQLLQLTGPSEFSPNDEHGNVSLLNNSPQPASLPDR